MSLPLRLSTTGIVGLAALSAVQWLRENIAEPAPVLEFVLGVMPNFAAAFAMPLVLASFFPSTSGTPVTVRSRRAYLWILLFTTVGLFGWEFLQARSESLVFDVYDLLATGLGSCVAYFAFGWHASGFEDSMSRRRAARSAQRER